MFYKAAQAATQPEIAAQFNGYDVSKLPPILISLSAKLFCNGGMFWEQSIDHMPSKLQLVLNQLAQAHETIEQLQAKVAELREALKETSREYRSGYLKGGSIRVSDMRTEAIASTSTQWLDNKLTEAKTEALEAMENQEEILHKINDWIVAYPLNIFPEPDFKKAAQVLKDAGMTLDAISASNMRHVLKGIAEIINKE